MKAITLQLEELTEKTRAHEYLKELFDFPEYYGNNLDALYDCLTELSEKPTVVIEGHAEGYAERVLRVLREAAELGVIELDSSKSNLQKGMI